MVYSQIWRNIPRDDRHLKLLLKKNPGKNKIKYWNVVLNLGFREQQNFLLADK
jgi:hypothetical protein